MKLWIDEDLSHTLVSVAREAGYDATCNRDRSMLGADDISVATAAIAEDFIVVTDNRRDFRKLYEPADHLHPGLMFIPGGGTREMQQARLRAAIGWIEEHARLAGEPPEQYMVNKLVEMDPATLTIRAEWLPVGAP